MELKVEFNDDIAEVVFCESYNYRRMDNGSMLFCAWDEDEMNIVFSAPYENIKFVRLILDDVE